MIHHVRMGREVKRLVEAFPALLLEATIQPITRTVLRVRLTVKPDFKWDDRIHGNTCEPWWVWVEDAENEHIYHSEYFLLQQKQVLQEESQVLMFTIPIFEPLPPQYLIKMVSDRWLGAEAVTAISFKHLILPELHPPHTRLLDLHPLPVSALKRPQYEVLYKFPYFNPIQTQLFHTLYHTDTNVLLGAPTGNVHCNIYLSIALCICPLLCVSVHCSMYLSIALCICPLLYLSVHCSIYLSIALCICPLLYLSVPCSIYLSIVLCICPFCIFRSFSR